MELRAEACLPALPASSTPDQSFWSAEDARPALAGGPTRLLVLVDAEEEFDWDRFSRDQHSVDNMLAQRPADDLFTAHGVTPTYLLTYPVVTHGPVAARLRDMHEAGRIEIGAQLHPWVTPPFSEELAVRNTYAGNLPAALERTKLEVLTEAIERSFNHRPTIYRAGRYGVGPNTPDVLASLGYEVDTSVVPHTNLARKHGPDFRNACAAPFWFGPGRRLLEIPLTVGFVGRLAAMGPRVSRIIDHPLFNQSRLGGVLARSRMLSRVRLTPEGVPVAYAMAVTRVLHAMGQRLFVLNYHSSSLLPGKTSYVRNDAELTRFIDFLRTYLAFFFDELGGEATTVGRERERALAAPRAP